MKSKKETIHPHTARYIVGIWSYSKLKSEHMALYHVIWYNEKPPINTIKNVVFALLENEYDYETIVNSFFDMYDRETTNKKEQEIIQFIDDTWVFSPEVEFVDINKKDSSNE